MEFFKIVSTKIFEWRRGVYRPLGWWSNDLRKLAENDGMSMQIEQTSWRHSGEAYQQSAVC